MIKNTIALVGFVTIVVASLLLSTAFFSVAMSDPRPQVDCFQIEYRLCNYYWAIAGGATSTGTPPGTNLQPYLAAQQRFMLTRATLSGYTTQIALLSQFSSNLGTFVFKDPTENGCGHQVLYTITCHGIIVRPGLP